MKVYAASGPGAPLESLDVDTPQPTGREVLLRVTHSGVCHSDLHGHEGGYDLGSQGFLSIADRGLEYPAVFGHEVVGEVVAAGDEAQNVEIGDRRLVFPWIGCGECLRCRSGQTNMCRTSRALGVFRWGGFGTHILVPDSDYLVPIGELDPAWAATLACSGVTSYSSVNRVLPLEKHDTVLVIGAGGVGLNAVSILTELTEAQIVVADVSDERLAVASDLGADRTVNTSTLDEGETLSARLGGSIQAAIDFVNTGETFRLAFDSLDKAGTLVAVGLFGGEAIVPTAQLPLKAISVLGNYVGNLAELQSLVELAQTAQLPQFPIEKRELSLDGVTSSMSDLKEGKVRGRIVLTAEQ